MISIPLLRTLIDYPVSSRRGPKGILVIKTWMGDEYYDSNSFIEGWKRLPKHAGIPIVTPLYSRLSAYALIAEPEEQPVTTQREIEQNGWIEDLESFILQYTDRDTLPATIDHDNEWVVSAVDGEDISITPRDYYDLIRHKHTDNVEAVDP